MTYPTDGTPADKTADGSAPRYSVTEEDLRDLLRTSAFLVDGFDCWQWRCRLCRGSSPAYTLKPDSNKTGEINHADGCAARRVSEILSAGAGEAPDL